jgi:hypothetical protein
MFLFHQKASSPFEKDQKSYFNKLLVGWRLARTKWLIALWSCLMAAGIKAGSSKTRRS